MKDLFIIVVILAIVFGGSFFLSNYFEKTGKEIIDIVDTMSEDLEMDNKDEKIAKIAELKEKWDKTQSVWIMLQYHDNINAIEDFIIECCNYYIYQNREEFDIARDKIIRSIEDLKYKEQFTLMNIM